VGIGTTTPQAAVDVAGSIVLSDGNAFAINKYWSSGWKYKANGWGGHMQYFGTGGFGLFVNPQNSSGTGAAVTDIQALMVTPTGNVGIGITTPGQLLSVYGSITNGFMQGIYNTGGSTTSDGLAISAGSNSTAGAVMVYLIRPDGTAIGSITQNSATTVAYNTTSDRRIKENIADSASGLDLLTKIKVRDYNYIADPDKQTQQGFIAQELYDIYPQAVTVGGEDPKTHPWQVDYGKLTPLLVKSVQDLQSENDQLKARADKAEADIRAKDAAIAQLKAESANLKAALCAKFSDLPICASNLAE
ncbi:MAG: tail fiber domain-containing protein, partial [Proteobacteria bacterium]|nr:tail fiber domain-containing protein [Pseudomonadota bacterium]